MKWLLIHSMNISLFLYFPTKLDTAALDQFIIWNVGQGQWTSLVTPATCYHFDMGGEIMNWKHLTKHCQKKVNRLYISHPDWDHISWINKATTKLPELCLANNLKEVFSPTELRPIRLTKKCLSLPSFIKILKPPILDQHSSKNDKSLVFLIHDHILIPGDSTKIAEKKWIFDIVQPDKISILVLGHHGSHTSTSRALIHRLNNLTMTVSSSRKQKYGHPHRTVTDFLKKNNIPNLTTESWGNIRFEITPSKKTIPKTLKKYVDKRTL